MSIVTDTGYSIHAADGRLLDHRDHFEEALTCLKATDDGETVRRVSDNELLATKVRTRLKAPRWAA
jgi:hypothetical protein